MRRHGTESLQGLWPLLADLGRRWGGIACLVVVLGALVGLYLRGLQEEAKVERILRHTTWCPTPAQREQADPWVRHMKIEEGIEHRWLHHVSTACPVCDGEGRAD